MSNVIEESKIRRDIMLMKADEYNFKQWEKSQEKSVTPDIVPEIWKSLNDQQVQTYVGALNRSYAAIPWSSPLTKLRAKYLTYKGKKYVMKTAANNAYLPLILSALNKLRK